MSCNIYSYAVLAIVSNSYPPLPGRLPTRYSPVRNSSGEASSSFSVLLACIRHAASVRPEPGSNSHLIVWVLLITVHWQIYFSFFDRSHISMSPCTWFVLFSFQRSLPPSETTILVYHLLPLLSTTFLKFFYIFLLFFLSLAFFLSMKLENRLKGRSPLPSF